jgi:peptidyl-prolyl cis-trans isomerase C
MLHNRSFIIGGIAGFSLALVGVGFFGCQKKDESGDRKRIAPVTGEAPGAAPQSPEELKVPLAKIDDVVITLGEFQERINRQSPYIRARYTSMEQKKEFLDTLVRFEILAKEATRRGFDKDPEVVRTMKQVMIQKLMKDEFETKVQPDDITEEEMQSFFKEHGDEYNKPEEVRVSAIILKNKSTAEKVAKEATSEKGQSNKGFRELVAAHSIDETTKIRGGDLRYFSRDTTEFPRPVVEAAFSLDRTGDVAGPIDAGNGTFYILKQTGRRKALSKNYEDVKRQIQNRIYRDKRTQSQQDFIDNLKKNAQVTVYDDNLKKVRIDTSARAADDGHGHGGMAPAFPAEAPVQE